MKNKKTRKTKNSPLYFTLLCIAICIMSSCKNEPKKEGKVTTDETQVISEDNEKMYRPNFHFSPKKGWMNDPNGMFYYNGYYHLYFQHYPDSTTWGPMHWGHAISTDMITWKEQPIALYPDKLGLIFSGSSVVDVENTSGFSEESKTPVVAMFNCDLN